ncbi:MAG: RNA-binding S4 domain-containing protein [Proteobacteria bacterium]|nr:RNA-binding S4 domain-containing protein [Pseudomonadota bacterium]
MSEERIRIDVWLWRARFAKTRAAAARLVSEGGVRMVRQDGVSRALDKPSAEIGPGDKLLFSQRGAIRGVEVVDAGARRGSPAEARLLYADLDAGPLA